MSRLPSSQPSSEQNQPERDSGMSRFSDGVPLPPVLTSYEAGWDSVSLEYHCQPAGETPNLSLDHYTIGIYIGQDLQLEHQMDGVAKGRVQKEVYAAGSTTLIPAHHSYWGLWKQPAEAFVFNLKSNLLTRNAAECLAVDQVELLPRTLLYDPLILQIALALKADLESHKPGGRLYAETMTHALAVHLLRNYSSHHRQSIRYPGGLSSAQLKPVIDYINAHLEEELSLEELATIAQLSPYHFCRSFKQSMGFTPHQYVIRQRVERAKLLLKDGKLGILEVALACGFTHQSHLNRHFKRLTGVTPKFFSNS